MRFRGETRGGPLLRTHSVEVSVEVSARKDWGRTSLLPLAVVVSDSDRDDVDGIYEDVRFMRKKEY